MTKHTETDYIKLYEQLHNEETDYGTSGSNYFEEVCLVIDYLKPKTVLDYGCGKAILIKQLEEKYPDIKFYGYDPAIPERAKLPVKKADLILNTDVLEHIPETQLPDIIKEISQISKHCFFGVHHALAYTILANGENAHCTVKPIFWYYNLFEKYFTNLTVLAGRESYLHTVLTFPVKPSFIKRYEELMEKRKNNSIANLEIQIGQLNEKIANLEHNLNNVIDNQNRKRFVRFCGLKLKVHKH